MSELTPFLGLIKDDDNFEPWGADVRHNWDLLDAELKHLQDEIDTILSEIAALGGVLYGVATGVNTYTVSITGVTGYTTGVEYRIYFTSANTGPSTLNINGLGAKAIIKRGTLALGSGDLAAGGVAELVYDGTNLQIIGFTPAQSQTPPVSASEVLYGIASGTNTYTVAVNPLLTTYFAGLEVEVLFANANTGASTLNVNGIGAAPLIKQGSLALVTGDILAGQVIECIYDGSNFQVVGASAVAANNGALGNSSCLLSCSTPQTVPGSTIAAISFDTEIADPVGMHSGGSPTRITIVNTGVYLFTFLIFRTTAASLGGPVIWMRINGTIELTQGHGVTSSDSIVLKLTAGDYVEVMLDNSTANGNSTTVVSANRSPLFSAVALAAG